jgi:hypothetical protein
MKLSILVPISFLLLSACTGQVKTDDQSVKKITTITECLVLNGNFATPDSIHQQTGVKKYDSNNNILEDMDFWGQNRTPGGGLIYKYNSEGKKSDEYLLDIHLEASKSIYEYSENKGEKIKILTSGGKRKSACDYYDTIGNLVRTVDYYQDGKVMIDAYHKYNAAKQEIEQGRTLDGKPMPTHFMYYDEKGNVSEQKTMNANGLESSDEKFIYEGFDQHGNWKIRKSIINNKPHSIAVQKVEYK